MKRGRPKQIDREQVLETAMRVFWERGYAETSVRTIGDECSVGLQSIYNEFGSKDELFSLALDRYCEQRVGRQVAELLETNPAIDGLRALFDFWVEFHSDKSTHGCFLAQTLADFGEGEGQSNAEESIAAAARRYHQRNEKLFRLALDRAREQGDVPESLDTKSTARALVALATGIAVLGRSQVSRSFLVDVTQEARRLIGDGDA